MTYALSIEKNGNVDKQKDVVVRPLFSRVQNDHAEV